MTKTEFEKLPKGTTFEIEGKEYFITQHVQRAYHDEPWIFYRFVQYPDGDLRLAMTQSDFDSMFT